MLSGRWFRSSLSLKHILGLIATICFLVFVMLFYSEELSSLKCCQDFISTRGCNYSILIGEDINQNTYAFYNKNITFWLDDSQKNGLNAEILMDSGSERTDSDLFYGLNISLSKNEIAISKNISQKNNLSVNSYLFSFNRVNNALEEYQVKYIFPDFFGVLQNDNNYSKGVILMGKDINYLNNTTVDYLYSYREDYSLINKKGAQITGELTDWHQTLGVIRSNFIWKVILKIVLSVCLSISCLFILMYFNFGIYYKKREFGNTDVYKKAFIDISVYSCILFALSSFITMLLTLSGLYSSMIDYIICLASILGSSIFVFLVSKAIIRRY